MRTPLLFIVVLLSIIFIVYLVITSQINPAIAVSFIALIISLVSPFIFLAPMLCVGVYMYAFPRRPWERGNQRYR